MRALFFAVIGSWIVIACGVGFGYWLVESFSWHPLIAYSGGQLVAWAAAIIWMLVVS